MSVLNYSVIYHQCDVKRHVQTLDTCLKSCSASDHHPPGKLSTSSFNAAIARCNVLQM